MCLNPDAVELALKVMAKVSTSCCKNKEDECEFFERCGYQRQIALLKQNKPRVVIVAADTLFHENTAIGTPQPAAAFTDSFRTGGRQGNLRKMDRSLRCIATAARCSGRRTQNHLRGCSRKAGPVAEPNRAAQQRDFTAVP